MTTPTHRKLGCSDGCRHGALPHPAPCMDEEEKGEGAEKRGSGSISRYVFSPMDTKGKQSDGQGEHELMGTWARAHC